MAWPCLCKSINNLIVRYADVCRLPCGLSVVCSSSRGVKRWDAGTKQSSGGDRKMMSSVSGVPPRRRPSSRAQRETGLNYDDPTRSLPH